MKDFLELTNERYSVRKYSDKQIEEEKLEKILKAGQNAPSAANLQPQRIYVIKSKEALEKIREFTPYAFNAPTVLMICYDKNISGKTVDGHDSGYVDSAIATTQMMFEAYDLGIGSVWVRGYDCRELEKIFDIPENMVSVALMPIGYPAEDSEPNPLHYKNIAMDDMVTYL